MKKYILMVLILTFTGCATISVPKYVKDANPYKKIFYRDFNKVQKAVVEVIEAEGFKVIETADPLVYESGKGYSGFKGEQTLIITDTRQTAFILGTRYARINLLIRTIDVTSTEVEIRYMTITQIPFKSFYSYNKKVFAEKVFRLISKKLI